MAMRSAVRTTVDESDNPAGGRTACMIVSKVWSVFQLPQTRIKYLPDVSLCRVRREALLLDEVQQFISLDGLHVTRAPRTHR